MEATKDVPDGVIAVGNPCKVIRKITEEDRIFWERQEKEYLEDEDIKKDSADHN